MMGYDGGWGGLGIVRGFAGRATHKDNTATAPDILDRRFAAGEIGQAEYEQTKRALGGSTPSAR